MTDRIENKIRKENQIENRFIAATIAFCIAILAVVATVFVVWKSDHSGHNNADFAQVQPLSPQFKSTDIATEFDVQLFELRRLVLSESSESETQLEKILSQASHAQMIDCVFFLTGLVDGDNYSKVRRSIEIAKARCEEAAIVAKNPGTRISLFESVDHAASVINEFDRGPQTLEIGAKDQKCETNTCS